LLNFYVNIYIFIVRWNAACMIQRNFRVTLRRIIENDDNKNNNSLKQRGKKMIEKLRSKMQKNRSVYNDRIEACTIITVFLQQIEKQVFKSALRLYIK